MNVFDYSFLYRSALQPLNGQERSGIFDGKGRSETIAKSRNERITVYLCNRIFLNKQCGFKLKNCF